MKQYQHKLRLSAVIAFMVTALCVGVVYIWSAFKLATVEYYSWTPAAVNLVASIMLFAFTGGSFIGGFLQDRFGPRIISIIGTFFFGGGIFASSLLPRTAPIGVFYVTYGVIAGLGVGFVFNSTLSGMQKWFPHRLGLATGLGAAAFGMSSVVFSPICSALIARYDVAITLRIFSICTFVVCLVACMFIRLPGAEYTAERVSGQTGRKVTTDNMNLPQAMRTVRFWLFFLCLFFYNGAWNMVTPLIRGLGVERGLTDAVAVLCLSLTGAANALGRITMAPLSDKIGRIRTMYVLCILTALSSAGLAFLGGGGYFFVVLLCAFAYGGPAAVFPAMCTDMFGQAYSGRNYGFLMLGLGLSSVVFNIISNALYAATGRYLATFIMGVITALVTLILTVFIRKMTPALARKA